jgi:hypothetical protein
MCFNPASLESKIGIFGNRWREYERRGQTAQDFRQRPNPRLRITGAKNCRGVFEGARKNYFGRPNSSANS